MCPWHFFLNERKSKKSRRFCLFTRSLIIENKHNINIKVAIENETDDAIEKYSKCVRTTISSPLVYISLSRSIASPLLPFRQSVYNAFFFFILFGFYK